MVTITGKFLTGKNRDFRHFQWLVTRMCAASHLVPDPSVLKKLQTCRRTRPAEVRHMPEAAFGHLFRFHLLQMLSGAAADL